MVLDFLKDGYPLDKHFLLVPAFALKLLGFYPETKRTLPVQLWALFNFSWHTYATFTQYHFGVVYMSTDVPTALDALCPAFSSILSWVKYCCIWWYRDDFKVLIERVRELNLAQQSEEKNRIKKRFFTLATFLTFLVFLGCFCTALSYSMRPIIINVFRYFYGQPVSADMPFHMIMPAFLLRMPIYPLTLILAHWYGFVTAIGLAGGDGFFLGFCFYFTTLLKSLALDLKATVKDASDDARLRRLSEYEVRAKLSKILDRHNEIIELTAKFSKVIALLTLGHFVTSSIIIGTCVVDLMLFSGYGIVIYVVYTIAVLCEIFLYCLGGTAIMESSADLADTAYCSHWYSYSVKVQKMVLLIIIRSQRALTVKVPFFAPSLPVLTSILRFTGSLIALANELL